MMWKMIEDCSMIHFCSAESQTDINLGKVNSLYYFQMLSLWFFPSFQNTQMDLLCATGLEYDLFLICRVFAKMLKYATKYQ